MEATLVGQEGDIQRLEQKVETQRQKLAKKKPKASDHMLNSRYVISDFDRIKACKTA